VIKMEFFELIEKRYSCRKFTDEEVKKEDLEQIIHAASISPSGKNIQNWHFVVIRNKEILHQMGEVVRGRVNTLATHLPQEIGDTFIKFTRFSTFFENAPVVVCAYAKYYNPESYDEMLAAGDDKINIDRLVEANPWIQGIGGAIEQMILAAFNLGYGACWMTSANNSLVELEKLIGYKDDESMKLIALVPIGVPAGERKSPSKREISEISTWID
jgi:nitroreductase